MNVFKKTLPLILVFAMLFALAAPGASAVSEDCCEMLLVGQENYTEAFEVLTLVNELRASLGIQQLVMDDTLMEYAMLRASELAMYFSHTRPNGSSCFDGCSMVYGENIAYGAYTRSSAQEAYTAWYNSQGHYENMVRDSYNSIGIGMFQIGYDYYWVQVFGFAAGSGAELADFEARDGVYVTRTVTVLEEIVQKTIVPVTTSTSLVSGESAQIYMDCSSIYSAYLSPAGFTFESSDENICTVDGDGLVTAKGGGKASVTISCPGLSEPWSVVFSVCPGHEYDDGVVTVEPGCDFWDRGETTYTCIHCGKTYAKTLYGSHTYDEGVITLEPTCGTQGTTTYTCSRCKTSYTNSIPATGDHVYDKGVVTEEATCKDWGTTTYTCQVCGNSKTEAIQPHSDHTYGDGEITREPTCLYQGFLQYSCTVCNGGGYIEAIDALGHDWDEGILTREASCTQQGILTHTCSRCHSTTEEALSFGEHRWDDGELTQRPTLDKVGEMTYTCEFCGTTRTEPAELPAGDVSGDGITDAADIVSLMKYILDRGDRVNNEALDVTGNGRVDILDVIRLIRHLADTSVQLS